MYLIYAILLVLPTLTQALDAPIRLQYPLHTPVTQRSRVTVEVTQRQPDHSVSLSAYQEAEAQIALNEPPTNPPYELTLTLNRLRVGLETEDKKLAFDSESSKDSPLMSALSQMIGQPMQLAVGESLKILNPSKESQVLMKDLKLMGGFNVTNLISEMVQQRFALANQPLQVGNRYLQVLKQGIDGHSPIELTYHIVEISPTEVRAVVTGSIPPSTLQWMQNPLAPTSTPSTLKVTGTINGKAVWNRENALLYRAKLNYFYRGEIADDNTPFELKMTHHDVSQLDH
jgi:hypothetical protein